MKPEPSHLRLQYLLLLATTLIWGTSFILIKKAAQVFAPMELGSLRIVIGCCFFLPVFLLRWRELPKGMGGWILLSGLMGSFFPSLLFSLAGGKIDSALSGMLNAVTPLFTVLIGIAFFGQRFSALQWVGILTGLAGALVLGLFNGGGIALNLFILPVLLATLFYALNVNLLKVKFSKVSPLILSSGTIIAVGPAAMVLLFGFTEFTQKMQVHPDAWKAFFYVALLGVFSTAIALVLFNRLIQIAGALVASSVTYMMPVVSLLWGVWDGETLGWHRLTGLVGILAGVYLVNLRKKNPSEDPSLQAE
jgi:drug/metabolite transporter (DMT)-like permease